MENNKYYTPELEEFHVGFEYEFKHSDYDKWNKYNTPEFNFEREDCIPFSGNLDCFRVKYLDRDDIESLGWKHDYNDDGEEQPSLNNIHGYSLGFSIDLQLTSIDTCYTLHKFPNNYLIIDSIVNCGSGRENMLFRGFIKNKSELQKLMQQLNIK